ncbi:MAG: hypothetical protein EP326_09810 [Deltaproteobacteria bacterium]|nr:MAG: hypothetical protein EP326_09810 [Deltaproteobacteria bacterium]TNF31909.1 MAG: hypothetical protein EP319_00815 [Deltaproteobacteria bacterium]
MKFFKILSAFFILILALSVAFLSKNPKTFQDRKQMNTVKYEDSFFKGKKRVELKSIKPLELNWAKDNGETLSMKDLRILKDDVSDPKKHAMNDSREYPKQESVTFRLRPSEDLYWKIQENNFDVESALKEIDLKKPPVKGEIQINF